MTIENKTLIETPVGEILFMALSKPVTSYSGEAQEYTIRLKFDEANEGVSEFKNVLTQINPNKVITSVKNKGTGLMEALPKGMFHATFKSAHKPKVLDGLGEALEDIPMFYSDTDSGTAQLIVSASTLGKQGTAYLNTAKLLGLDIKPRAEQEVVSFAGVAETLAAARAKRNSK